MITNKKNEKIVITVLLTIVLGSAFVFSLLGKNKTSAKEKELLFTIAKVLRFKKSGESRLWIIKNVGNDPQLTAKIYDICDTLSDTDARSIREKLGDL